MILKHIYDCFTPECIIMILVDLLPPPALVLSVKNIKHWKLTRSIFYINKYVIFFQFCHHISTTFSKVCQYICFFLYICFILSKSLAKSFLVLNTYFSYQVAEERLIELFCICCIEYFCFCLSLGSLFVYYFENYTISIKKCSIDI